MPPGATTGPTWESPTRSCPRARGETPESIVDPAGPRIWFQQVPEPKVAKNRIHFDLQVGGGREVPLATRTERVNTKVDLLTRAGATVLPVLDEPDMAHYGVVLQDPEGNEFCVA